MVARRRDDPDVVSPAGDAADARLLREQIEYYRARAPEYDAWVLREGRYDRGPEHRVRWNAEREEIAAALAAEGTLGSVLEVAAGTGQWTGRLAGAARRVTALDTSVESLAINRARHGGGPIDYVAADVFDFSPRRRYDFVFLGFWLSHVPASRFGAFWEQTRSWITDAGRVFLVDSAWTPESTAKDHPLPEPRAGVVGRRLDDGREYRVVKLFHEPSELARRLGSMGWSGWARRTAEFFVYGRWNPAASQADSASNDSIRDSSSATSSS